MMADYIISRLDNGYVLADSNGERYFRRLHDLLTYVKDEELGQDYADATIEASIVEEQDEQG